MPPTINSVIHNEDEYVAIVTKGKDYVYYKAMKDKKNLKDRGLVDYSIRVNAS